MEGLGELIKVESQTMNELKGELAEAYKTIAEKDAEVKRLLEKITVLEKRHIQSVEGADAREPEVVSSPTLERKAEEIIPKECWGLVFQNLNAEDLLRCRQVCKAFNEVLDAKEFKEKWQFHLIFPLVFPYLKTSDPDCDPWENLYNARLVCRSWRDSIGKFASYVHGKQRRQSFFPRMSEMPLVTGFRTSEDIDEFQEKFGECSTNPFPSRSVYIGNPSDPEENEDYSEQTVFIRKVGRLLKQFGKHIFRLRLCFNYEYISGVDPLTLCKLIRSITIRLPNLKELLIRNGPLDWDEEYKDEVATYIEENALAALPKLRVLNIDALELDKMEDYLLDAFGPQLTELEMAYAENPLRQFQMQQFKNVRKLWLAVHKHDSLESLQFLHSPLELLKLTCETQETWNMDRLLRNLRHLPIELLEIHLWHMDRVNLSEAGMDMEEYNNATIKTLIIHIDRPQFADGHQISLNFLQALTKLENLEFKFSRLARKQLRITHPGELPEVVKLNGYLFGGKGTDLPYHSNVWEKVPTLKTLTLTWDRNNYIFRKSIYTREKYERITAEGDNPERN